MTPIWLLAVLTACKKEPATPIVEDTGKPSLPSVYEYEIPDVGIAFDQAAVEASIATAVGLTHSLNAQPVIDAYVVSMDQSDSTCPQYYEVDGSSYWSDSCTTSTGATFSGYAFGYEYVDTDIYGDGSTLSGMVVYGQMNIESTEGSRLQFGGQAFNIYGTNTDGAYIYQSGVVGGFDWDGSEATGTWLDGELSPNLTMFAVDWEEYQGRAILLNGGVAGVDDSWGTVVFNDLFIANAEIGWPCPGEPGGGISVRDDDGHWYDIEFDVNSDTWTMPAGTCDGCGTVLDSGIEIGSICADFSPLLSWEDQPW